jgi:hypothetical protein
LIIIFVVLFMPGGVLGLVEERVEVFRSKDLKADANESEETESF